MCIPEIFCRRTISFKWITRYDGGFFLDIDWAVVRASPVSLVPTTINQPISRQKPVFHKGSISITSSVSTRICHRSHPLAYKTRKPVI